MIDVKSWGMQLKCKYFHNQCIIFLFYNVAVDFFVKIIVDIFQLQLARFSSVVACQALMLCFDFLIL